jgi:ubiquinone/menaquinone biosynthesis C-methylase UbiE
LKKIFESNYHLLEKNHWWFRARRDIILKIITQLPLLNKNSEIIDVGCSTGILLKKLSDAGYDKLTGMEISSEALLNASFTNIILFDGEKLPFPDEMFDCLIASDVLEHIEKDEDALKEWKRVLIKKGIIICFVPAYQRLWSYHDVVNMHYRRYSLKKLVKVFKKNDFVILRKSYWNSFIFFPSLIYRIFSKLLRIEDDRGDLKINNNLINEILYKILSIENRILAKINFPFGLSAFIIAKKYT